MLNPSEKQRVLAAIQFDPNIGDVVSLVESLQSSMEFHQFVLNYNCNDGFLPLRTIIASPNCDYGTAIHIYWHLQDFVFDRDSFRDENDPEWDGVSLVEEIERRVRDDFYTTKNIQFNPLEFLDWSPIRLERIKLEFGGEFPFPAIMLECTPGKIVAQESLE